MPMISTGCTDSFFALIRTNNPHYDLYESINIFLDIENIIPTEEEQQACEMVSNFLVSSNDALEYFQDYKNGASANMKQTFESNDPEIQQQTFQILKKHYEQAKKCLEVDARLRQIVPSILWSLVKGPLPLSEQLNICQALCCHFGFLIDFVVRFDALKMETPTFLNDISFYRRMVSQLGRSDCDAQCSNELQEEHNLVFLFAEHTPMLKALVESTASFVKNAELKIENTVDTLACFVSVCRQMLDKDENRSRLTEESQNFFARVMVGAFILLDHISETGAFSKQSPVDLKSLVNVIKMNESESEKLLSAIKYMSKNFNDPKTPQKTKALFN